MVEFIRQLPVILTQREEKISPKFTRHAHIPALLFLLLAMLACSVQIDPFGTTPTPSTLPHGLPSSTPTVAPPTVALATNTPPADLPTATPSSAAVVSPAILKFKMLDANNGWALSDINVLRSSDGGTTWLNATPGGLSEVGYAAAFFPDAAEPWAFIPGSDFTTGTLYRTQDGGANWTSVSVPFGGGDLKFIDQNNGLVLASLGAGAGSEAIAVFQTGDCRTTWARNYVNDPTVSGAGNSLPLGGQKSGMTLRDTTHGWVSGQTPVEDY